MAEQKCLSVVGLRSQTIVVKFLYMLITKDQIYAIVAHVLLILTGKYLNSLLLPLTAECKHIFSAVTRASLRASAVKLCCFQVWNWQEWLPAPVVVHIQWFWNQSSRFLLVKNRIYTKVFELLGNMPRCRGNINRANNEYSTTPEFGVHT